MYSREYMHDDENKSKEGKVRLRIRPGADLARRTRSESSEAPEPAWRNKAIEGMSPEDTTAVNSLRSFLKEKNLKQWVYAGSNVDIVPSFIAPLGSTINMVDVGFRKHHYWHKPDQINRIQDWFAKLGTKVEKRELITVGDGARGKTRILLDEAAGGTELRLIGVSRDNDQAFPDRPEVIFSTSVSPDPAVEVYDRQPIGGLIVFAHSGGSTFDVKENGISYNFTNSGSNISYQDLGYRFVKKVLIKNAFPSSVMPSTRGISTISDQPSGDPVEYYIFEKTRAIGEWEKAALGISCSLSDIELALTGVLTMDELGHPESQIEDYTQAVDRLKKRFEDARRKITSDEKKELVDMINEFAKNIFSNKSKEKYRGYVKYNDAHFQYARNMFITAIQDFGKTVR
jgi:hypothetical protein